MLGDYAVIDEVMQSFEYQRIRRMKVIELKSLCRDRGFQVSGVKADLIRRLITNESK